MPLVSAVKKPPNGGKPTPLAGRRSMQWLRASRRMRFLLFDEVEGNIPLRPARPPNTKETR